MIKVSGVGRVVAVTFLFLVVAPSPAQICENSPATIPAEARLVALPYVIRHTGRSPVGTTQSRVFPCLRGILPAGEKQSLLEPDLRILALSSLYR